MHERYTTTQQHEHFRRLKLDRFRFFSTPETYLERCLKWTPPLKATKPMTKAELIVIRVVTKYHPRMARGLQLKLDALQKRWQLPSSSAGLGNFVLPVVNRGGGKTLEIFAKQT